VGCVRGDVGAALGRTGIMGGRDNGWEAGSWKYRFLRRKVLNLLFGE
jgi:hypothetical protein